MLTDLEQALRENADPLTYISFFGVLISLALAELAFELGHEPADRRRRWPTNWGLTALNIVLLGAVPVTALGVADMVAATGQGTFARLDLPPWAAFVAGILARSLGSWVVHLAMHKIPVLWRVHRVHHSDLAMDVSTTVRFHPLEFAIQMPVTLALIWTLGIPPVAILVYELADAIIAAFSHANVRLPRRLEKVLAWVIVTPHMHRVHHSAYHRETDSNYGATLSIWDRLFGTFVEKDLEALAEMEIGLRECRDQRSRQFGWLVALPFLGARIPGPKKKPGEETPA